MSDIKLTKREERIEAIKILYMIEVNNISLNLAIKSDELVQVNDDIISFVNNVLENKEKIDTLLRENLTNYKPERLNLIDKKILEVAIGEMIASKTPKQIIINEALEISKIYTLTDNFNSVAFNNKVLDRIASKLGL